MLPFLLLPLVPVAYQLQCLFTAYGVLRCERHMCNAQRWDERMEEGLRGWHWHPRAAAAPLRSGGVEAPSARARPIE